MAHGWCLGFNDGMVLIELFVDWLHESLSTSKQIKQHSNSPLIAIANVLLLRGDIDIHPDQRSITFEELNILLKDYLQADVSKMLEKKHDEQSMANALQELEEVQKLLRRLEKGLGNPMLLVIDLQAYADK